MKSIVASLSFRNSCLLSPKFIAEFSTFLSHFVHNSIYYLPFENDHCNQSLLAKKRKKQISIPAGVTPITNTAMFWLLDWDTEQYCVTKKYARLSNCFCKTLQTRNKTHNLWNCNV